MIKDYKIDYSVFDLNYKDLKRKNKVKKSVLEKMLEQAIHL